ncbi:MAG TPA: glycosyltransferase family 2 protein [Candidatus Hydrogenedentes bacterium]|nr:glycosyltransferase family 2 protein [Candidatus Hydrogenedentota bacterium]HOL75400.1 glycosyltransferase family 2 protein [Candidatus Hydrogenedentota bacterium]HPO84909.1 glycosyltransferase family 2 protein [Candidatus Hydrogenedentota bacterium]
MGPDTAVLLPAYNEADHIGNLLRRIREIAPESPCVVVDDGSTDHTAELAREAGAFVISHPFNMGYGVALQTGYKFVVRRGYSYLVQLDADGQHDPRFIPVLWERVASGHCDLCIGSRFLEGETYSIPFARRAGMFLFRRIASALVRTTITDPTSGYQAMNRRVLDFFIKDIYPTDYPDTDVLVMLYRNQFRIAEAPVIMHAAQPGKSIHSGLKPVYYLFKMALDIPLNLIRREEKQ